MKARTIYGSQILLLTDLMWINESNLVFLTQTGEVSLESLQFFSSKEVKEIKSGNKTIVREDTSGNIIMDYAFLSHTPKNFFNHGVAIGEEIFIVPPSIVKIYSITKMLNSVDKMEQNEQMSSFARKFLIDLAAKFLGTQCWIQKDIILNPSYGIKVPEKSLERLLINMRK